MIIGRQRILAIAASFLVIVFTIAGRLAGGEGKRERTYEDLGSFTEVLQLVNSSYVDEVDEDSLMVGAFRGMLASLDPQSGWLSPAEVRDLLAEDQPRAGTGIEATKRGGYAYVVAIRQGSPAEKAGVHVGDYIRTLDTASTREMSIFQVRRALSGKPGTIVRVNLFGDGEGRVVDVRREVFDSPATTTTLRSGGLLVIKVNYLEPHTITAIRKSLTAPPGPFSQVLLDLRNTVGGDRQDGVALADLFLNAGVIVKVETRKEPQASIQADAAQAWGGRLAVLVNGMSAGPVEIAVAALKGNARARVLGESTGGDASVQKLIRLPDESAVILSVGRYLNPSGATWAEKGIEPDVKVLARAAADGVADGPGLGGTPDARPEPGAPDLQLEGAVEILKGGESAAKSAA